MNNTIQLRIKNVFGNKRYYAECPLSQMLLKLMNRQTFTERDVELLKENSWKIAFLGEYE